MTTERLSQTRRCPWEKWMATICKPFTMSSIKHFDAKEEGAAHDWLISTD